jgi:hypothetical protein
MRRRMGVLVATIVATIAVAIPAIGIVAADGTTNASEFVATLTGSGEVPPIPSTTKGIAHVTIDVDKRLICYDFSITGRRPVAAHIHEGAVDANGPIAVDFSTFGMDIMRRSEGCTRKIARQVLEGIVENPAGYYVNIHTAQNPGGEVRGQLAAR